AGVQGEPRELTHVSGRPFPPAAFAKVRAVYEASETVAAITRKLRLPRRIVHKWVRLERRARETISAANGSARRWVSRVISHLHLGYAGKFGRSLAGRAHALPGHEMSTGWPISAAAVNVRTVKSLNAPLATSATRSIAMVRSLPLRHEASARVPPPTSPSRPPCGR